MPIPVELQSPPPIIFHDRSLNVRFGDHQRRPSPAEPVGLERPFIHEANWNRQEVSVSSGVVRVRQEHRSIVFDRSGVSGGIMTEETESLSFEAPLSQDSPGVLAAGRRAERAARQAESKYAAEQDGIFGSWEKALTSLGAERPDQGNMFSDLLGMGVGVEDLRQVVLGRVEEMADQFAWLIPEKLNQLNNQELREVAKFKGDVLEKLGLSGLQEGLSRGQAKKTAELAADILERVEAAEEQNPDFSPVELAQEIMTDFSQRFGNPQQPGETIFGMVAAAGIQNEKSKKRGLTKSQTRALAATFIMLMLATGACSPVDVAADPQPRQLPTAQIYTTQWPTNTAGSEATAPDTQDPAPTPTTETVPFCGIDAAAFVFSPDFRVTAGNPVLGVPVETDEGYLETFGISPEIAYDPQQPETAVNWYVQRQLAAIGVQLAENGRAVILPGFAQGVGLEEVIRRDAPEAQIFFAGVNDGQAPATALRAVMDASPYGGYVINLEDDAGNYYLLVEEGTGEMLGFPDQVGVEVATDVVRLAGPDGGQVVPMKVDGCNWILGAVGDDGRVGAALAVEPETNLAWQMNPNPPEAVAPTEIVEEWQMYKFCYETTVDYVPQGDICELLTPEMTRPLADSEVTHLYTRSEVDGSLVPLPDGRVPVFDTERYGENGDFWINRGMACTVRGWVPFPYDSDYPNKIMVFCEARLDAGDSQAVWFDIADTGRNRLVEWMAGGVVPESAEAPAERSEVNPMALIDLFRSGAMDGRQIVIRYMEDSTTAVEERQTIPLLALRQALETGEGIDWEDVWPLNVQRYYFDEAVRALLEGE